MSNVITLTAPEGYIYHHRGSGTYEPIRRVAVLDSQRGNWELVPEADIPASPPPGYAEEVERLIRQRYTTGEELAILRQRDTKPEGFADYYAYAEQCKQQAKTAPVI